MKCIKCNEEIPAGVKFCPGCGSLTEKTVEERKISLKCDQCGGTLLIDSNKTVVACPYCGNKSLIAENDVVTIERIKTDAHKEIELEKIKREDRRQQRIEEKQEETNRIKEFKKGKWSKILLVAFLFSAIVTYLFFSKGYLGEGIIALAQTGCFGISWCMGMNIIKEKRRYVHVLVAALGIIMLLPTVKSCSSLDLSANVKKIKWSTIYMGDKIPEPKSNIGKISSNSDKYLSMYVHNTSYKEFKAYLEACEKRGYVIESDKGESRYNAYNTEGYRLSLWYIEDDRELSISLDAPEEMSEISWTTNGVGCMIPRPKSNIGKVTKDSSDAYAVKVGNTSINEYTDYVKECEAAGFIENYGKDDKSYSAKNKDGYELSIRYIGFNVMEVSITVPEETEQEENVEENKEKSDVENNKADNVVDDMDTNDVDETKKDSSVLVNGMRQEFKEAMDSYEAFYVEYCDVLEKYRNNPTDLSILTEYAELTERSAEMSEKFDAWDSEEMNNTELMYYLEVLGRVTKMLQSVGE